MTNDESGSKAQMTNVRRRLPSSFGHPFVIGHASFVIFLAFGLSIYGAPPASAKEILVSVRMLEARQQIDLEGELREDVKVIPFHLTQTGPLIRYSFANPEEVLQLRL